MPVFLKGLHGVVWFACVALDIANAADSNTYPSIWRKPTEIATNRGDWLGHALPVIGPRGVFLSNGVAAVGLATPANGCGIRSLYCTQTRREAICRPLEKPSLWQLILRAPNGRTTTLSNVDCAVVPTVETKSSPAGELRAVLAWQRVRVKDIKDIAGDLDVRVVITLSPADPVPRWRIAVTNRTKGVSLWRVIFPVVEHLGFPGESDALVHTTYSMMRQGELHRRARGPMNWLYKGDPETSMWPSGAMPIQHLSVSAGSDTVVYIAWHDGKAYPKGYVYDVDRALTCYAYPEDMAGEGVSYEQDYDVLLGPMPGDWFDAAVRYRRWARRQFWCGRGPKAKWPEFTRKHLLEVPVWSRPGWAWDAQGKPNPEANKRTVAWQKNAEQWLGPPLAVQWYGWHRCRFDGNYPEYFPAQPGFADEAKREAAVGWTVCPFINGLWYDLRTPKGREALPSAIAEDPAGKFTFPDPNVVDPLRQSSVHALMCPTSKWWRGELTAITQRLHRELGADMVYLDVFANAAPLACFNRAHAHPPGRGRWWVEEVNRTVAAVKSAKDGVRLVESECFNEALGATLDSNLIWTDRYPWECPLLGSVYGGWLDWNGSLDYVNENLTTFTLRLARDVYWGGAMGGWVEPENWWCATRENPRTGFILDLARFRRLAKDFLVYGDMVRPPDLAGEPVWVKLPGWQCTYFDPKRLRNLTLEAVERVAWRSPSGEVGLALLNCDDKPHPVAFDLSTLRGLRAASEVRVLQNEGSPPIRFVREGNLLRGDLSPRTPVLVVIGKDGGG